MSIGASEHRAFVRAKARFAGQRLRNTVLSVEMLLHRTYCVHRWWHFLAESAARALPFPTSQRPTCPLSFTPGGTPPARPSAASVASRCEPILAFPLLPGPSTHPAWLSAVSVSARYEPIPVFPLLPGPSTCPAWPSAAPVASRCEPILAFPLLPGPSTCPAWPSAVSVSAGCESFSLNRLTPAPCNSGSGPGTMAAGALEQAASCDAFVLSRRLPAPDAPPSRTSPACLVAKSFPEPSPTLSEPRPGDLLAGTAAANSVRLGQ